MDYDKVEIADRYDAGRQYRPEVLRRWLDLLAAHAPGGGIVRIVDLGCGTGRYSEALAAHFDASVVGVDPSERMLAQARRKASDARVTYKQGSGEDLPVEDGAADMVFLSMVLHHLPDGPGTACECRRVLRDGGRVCIRNSTIDAIETFPYLDFFPGVRSLIEATMPSRAAIEKLFGRAGLQTTAHEIVTHEMAPDWASFAEKIGLRSDSFLTRLPDEAFHAGLARLRDFARTAAPSGPVTEEVDFFVFQAAENAAWPAG